MFYTFWYIFLWKLYKMFLQNHFKNMYNTCFSDVSIRYRFHVFSRTMYYISWFSQIHGLPEEHMTPVSHRNIKETDIIFLKWFWRNILYDSQGKMCQKAQNMISNTGFLEKHPWFPAVQGLWLLYSESFTKCLWLDFGAVLWGTVWLMFPCQLQNEAMGKAMMHIPEWKVCLWILPWAEEAL